MASIVNQSSINYLRYFALGLGVWYGATRQAALTSYVEHRGHVQKQKEHEALVEEARVAYKAHLDREEAKAAAKDGGILSKEIHVLVITDSDDYRFDADKYATWAMAYYKVDEPAKQN